MKIDVEPGTYVAAVSGGVDSMVLLDLLSQVPGAEIVVAHFDHGVRPDSAEDRQLVQQAAQKYDRQFEYKEGNLGPDVSEADARDARYGFLEDVRQKYNAAAIITAHHQDDLLETAIINMIRGTGRKGLSSLRSRPGMLRPLLGFAKKQLQDYAQSNGIIWHEDSTNQSKDYMRNQIRQDLMPRLSQADRQELLNRIGRAAALNDEIDTLLNELLATQPNSNQISRYFFIMLPHAVACEFMAQWLRSKGLEFDRRTIERLVIFAKAAKPGKIADISQGNSLAIKPSAILFEAGN